MPRQKWCEVRSDCNRSDSWSTASVRDAERLVQIQVADVGTKVSGAAKSDLGVHVSAVHVNLSAVTVNDVTNLLLETKAKHAR